MNRGAVAACSLGCSISRALRPGLADIALRQSVKVDPFLVAAVKAVPTVVFLTPFVIWMRLTGQRKSREAGEAPPPNRPLV